MGFISLTKGLIGQFTNRFSIWTNQMNQNLRRIDLRQGGLKIQDQIATSNLLPILPNNGDSYVITSTKSVSTWFQNPGIWESTQLFVPDIFYDISDGIIYYFDGTNILPLPGYNRVMSVNGYYVDNLDPINPIITAPKITIENTAPTINDDSTQDFSIGSIWLDDVSGFVWMCTDATIASAVWVLINSNSVLNYVISGSSGGSISPVSGTGAVTNFSVNLTTTGNPVEIRVIPDGSSNASVFGNFNTGSSEMEFDIIFLRDSIEFARQKFQIFGENPPAGSLASFVGPGAIFALDESPPAGLHTYSIELQSISPTINGRILWSKMYVKEIK